MSGNADLSALASMKPPPVATRKRKNMSGGQIDPMRTRMGDGGASANISQQGVGKSGMLGQGFGARMTGRVRAAHGGGMQSAPVNRDGNYINNRGVQSLGGSPGGQHTPKVLRGIRPSLRPAHSR